MQCAPQLSPVLTCAVLFFFFESVQHTESRPVRLWNKCATSLGERSKQLLQLQAARV
jgi:hypothetical protein